MKRPEIIIMLGFILVTLGITFLAFSTSNFDGGFVFVFPFFFIGNIDSLGVVTIIGFMLFIVALFFFMFSRFLNFTRPSKEDMKTYIRYDTFCTFCGAAMPSDARFCSTCGHEQV